MSIDITGLNKAEVLACLYNASRQQGMGFMNARGQQQMTVEDAAAEIVLNPGLYFDYLRGRVMKISLKHDELEERLYDRDNGQGAAYRALAHLLQRATIARQEEPRRQSDDDTSFINSMALSIPAMTESPRSEPEPEFVGGGGETAGAGAGGSWEDSSSGASSSDSSSSSSDSGSSSSDSGSSSSSSND